MQYLHKARELLVVELIGAHVGVKRVSEVLDELLCHRGTDAAEVACEECEQQRAHGALKELLHKEVVHLRALQRAEQGRG